MVQAFGTYSCCKEERIDDLKRPNIFFTQNQYPLHDKNIYDESRSMLIELAVALNNTIIDSSYYSRGDQLRVVQNYIQL